MRAKHSLALSIAFSIGVYPLSGYTKYSLVLAAPARAYARGGSKQLSQFINSENPSRTEGGAA